MRARANAVRSIIHEARRCMRVYDITLNFAARFRPCSSLIQHRAAVRYLALSVYFISPVGYIRTAR